MNTNLVKKAGRRPEILYYDVTNFYFEIDDPDGDILDRDGNVLKKGLRKMGVSKEKRKNPIVQMGLFMDNNGIPIAIEEFPGNTLDHLTMRSALKKNIDGMDFSRFILIGDRGMCAYPNLLHLLDTGNGYIVAKSLLKSTAKDRQWAYSDDGYISGSSSFKYKSRIVSRKTTDENGMARTISEKEVVYWSENYARRQLKENKSFLEFLEKLVQSPANFRASAMQAKSLRKFLKKELLNEKTGEILDSNKLKAMIDIEKVKAFKKDMGYYLIVTSELEMCEKEVIEKYHALSRIEDQFRVMKGDLDTRPIFLRKPQRIKAHLTICLIALIMLRLIQNRIIKSGLVLTCIEKRLSWITGLSAERIAAALNKWQVDKFPDDYFRFLNLNDPDLKLILDTFNIQIPAKFYKRSELISLKTQTKIIM
jgi:transposase